MTKVAVYMICRNEAEFIKRAVLSARTADQIVVCDTGSSDETLQILQELAHQFPISVHSITISPWRYDDARNTALALVRPDIDCCVALDADEVLATGFIEALQNSSFPSSPFIVNHSFKTYWSWRTSLDNVSEHYHERIHSRFGFRWIHPVHEKLVAQETVSTHWMTELYMVQYPDLGKSRSSYHDLLLQAVIEDPNDWKLFSFLAQEQAQRGDIQQAIQSLHTALRLPNADQVYLNWELARLATISGDHVLAESLYMMVTRLDEAKYLRESWYLLARFYQQQHDVQGERAAIVRALACTTKTKGYLQINGAWNGYLEQRLEELDHDNC